MAVVSRGSGSTASYIDAQYGGTPRAYENPDDDEDEPKVALDHDGQPWTTTAPSSATPVVAPPLKASDKTHDQTVEDLGKLRNEIANRPVLSSPKWWQRGLGMAAGAMAGWSNAAGRTKNPIDVNELRDDILQPGNKQKLAEWNSRVQPLEQTAQIDTNLENLERQKRALDINDDYRKSEALKNQSIADWNNRRGVPVKPDPIELAQKRYDFAKGKLNMPEDAAQYYSANGNLNGYGSTLQSDKTPRNLNAEDILLHPKDFPPETVAAATKLHADKQHAAHVTDPLVQEMRQQRYEDMVNNSNDRVEKTKTTEFDKLHAARVGEIAATLKGSGYSSIEELQGDLASGNAPASAPGILAAVKRINGSYAGRLQGIQDAYERSIGVRHNSAGHMTVGVNPKTSDIEFGSAPPPSAAPQAAAPQAPKPTAAAPSKAAAPAAKSEGKLTVQLPDGTPLTGTQAQINAYLKEAGLTMAQTKRK